MRAYLAAIGVAAAAITAQPGAAGELPVLVELYTSQGCSSCPPADAHLAENLTGRDDVIALALHVDYWDYIGWKDAFANAGFTARQKAYARAAGHRTVYTPQMIVAGRDHVVGFRPMQLAEAIEQHRATADRIDLEAWREGDAIEIMARGLDESLPEEMVVQLVRYTPEAEVAIERGENAGRTITYANIVTSWEVIEAWDGAEPFTASIPDAGEAPAVIVVQEGTTGPVLGAARAD